MANFDELLPEEADERDQRLVHDLRRIYRTDTQTVEHLASIRQRLLANDDSSAYDYESMQQHVGAKRWMEAALSGNEAVGFTWVVLLGFVRLCTLPALFPTPLVTSAALDLVGCAPNGDGR